ncbi:MAG TPA: C1 family peptidase [Flavilitoribacter sp.]|nr:C1 family peptidase [Flavilitoribacter sp.]HMQ88290.1 C1 family peptidase [Flavilitoribacter sp.]
MKNLFTGLMPVLCCLSVLPLSAQDMMPKSARGLKLGITEEALIDHFLPYVPGAGSNARDLLEAQSLKPYMMPVRQVGVRGESIAYGASILLEFYVNLGKNFKVNLSPDYIGLNLAGAGKPVSFEETLNFLAREGTVNAAIVTYDAREIPGAVMATQKYKIVNYLHIFSDLTKERQRVFETKKALQRGNPVLFEVRADERIRSFTGARYWDPDGQADASYPLIVVGFNENDQAFEVLSCWGNQWGMGGYIWIKYDDFGKYARNGFVLLPEDQY